MFTLESSSLIGLVTAGIVEALKWMPQVPLVAGNTARIRTVATVLAFVGNLGVAFADGDTDALRILAKTLASFFVAFLTYKGIIKGTTLEAPAS